MKLLLKRSYRGNMYTIGKLYIDGEYFCDTLEDVVRPLPKACPNTPREIDCKCIEKVFGGTAIPSGTYKIAMGHSPKFNKVLPRLLNVPHFRGILIHSGSTNADTNGCILVGKNKVRGMVTQSKETCQKLIDIIKNEKCLTIDVV